MAIDMKDRGSIGCSYYLARKKTLYLMEGVKLGDLEIVDTRESVPSIKLHIQPTIILVSTRIDDSIHALLDPRSSSSGTSSNEDQSVLPYILETRPSVDFNFQNAKNNLINLRISSRGPRLMAFMTPGDSIMNGLQINENFVGRQESLHKLSALINIDCELTVGCAGAVLTYLQRRRAVEQLPGEEDLFKINSLSMFSLSGTMFITADTLASLQVLESEHHPHSHNLGPTKASSGSKEGLSVYGLFHHHAHTPQGKISLKQYFLRPSQDFNTINDRLNSVNIFLQPDNSTYVDSLVKCLKQIKNIRAVMINVHKGVSTSSGSTGGGIARSVWISIRQFVTQASKILEIIQNINRGRSLPIIILHSFDPLNFQRILMMIVETIDFQSTLEKHRTVVKSGIDPQLDDLKYQYSGIKSRLSRIAQDIQKTILVAQLIVEYIPNQGCYLITPRDPEIENYMITTDCDRMFSTDTEVYYKDNHMRELDYHFGDLYQDICGKYPFNMEIEIIHQLAQKILEHEELLTECSDICGELDSLIALTKGAQINKFCRPQITVSNVVNIKNGRHPLQELLVSSYVPNNTALVGGQGEKSFDHSTDDESLSDISLSAQPEGKNRHIPSTHRVSRGLSSENDAPSMLILTGPNYSEIFENGFLEPRPELSFGHMEIRIDKKAKSLDSQITYLYK
ncbi:MAG: MutS protein msh5 [Trizodia sp. TS-e1964]|nr:MAG: MutS protein msh5 [Trizodia sp. TS-e1964]